MRKTGYPSKHRPRKLSFLSSIIASTKTYFIRRAQATDNVVVLRVHLPFQEHPTPKLRCQGARELNKLS